MTTAPSRCFPATQEADGSNAPAVNETEAPKSENTAGDTAPKPVTTPTEERKEDTPQQELTEEKTEENVTPEPVKAKAEAPKPTQEPSSRAGGGKAGEGRAAGGGR